MLVKLCDTLTPTYEWMRLNFVPIPATLLIGEFFSSAEWVSKAKCHTCHGSTLVECTICEGSGKDEDYYDDDCGCCEGTGKEECPCCDDVHWDEFSWVFAIGSEIPSAQLQVRFSDAGFAVVKVAHKSDFYGFGSYAELWNSHVAGYYLVPNPLLVETINNLNGSDGTAVFWVPLRALVAREFCVERHMVSQWEELRAVLVDELKAGHPAGLAAFAAQFDAKLPAPKPKKKPLSSKKKLLKKASSIKKKLAKKPAKTKTKL